MAETTIPMLEPAVHEAMAQRRTALLAMNIDSFADLLDDTLRYTHSNGLCEDKATYLQALRQGIYVYHRIEEEAVEAFDLEGGVWCTGRTRMHATVNGTERHMHNRFVAVWRRTPGGLRLAAYCATPIPAST